VIEVDPGGESTEQSDLRIRGTEPEAEVISRIIELLTKRQIVGG
jgi:hexokinase